MKPRTPVTLPCPHCGRPAKDDDADGIAYCTNGCGLVHIGEINARVAQLYTNEDPPFPRGLLDRDTA